MFEANQSALNTLLEDEVDDDIQTAAIATARENLTKSQGVQTKAHNALYAATGPDRDGSIYRAGVAEWRAKGAVEAAIMSWNEAVSELATADTALTGSSETFGDYVPLQNSTTTAGQILSLITNPADAMSAVNIANVRTYANAEGGTDGATQDSTSGAITGTSNFDAAGNLLIPLEDGDSDADTPLTRVKSAQTYTVVNTQLTQVNNVVTALEKLQSDNKNALLQGAIDEAVRRAKLEQAHFQAQFDALVADNTDFDDDTTNGVQSFKTMYDEVRTAMTKRDNAGVTLETAVQTREAATKAVRAAFTNPQSFYQQLVDRRQYVKDQADAEVTRLAGLTGEDAPTEKQTADAAKEASDAAEALTDAQNVHASFQDLIADDSPVKGLVEELLKSNTGEDAGDDGGLLVSAIDGAYDATQANKGEIDTLKAQLTDADGNPIDLTNLGDSEQTATNTGDIEMLDGRVTENEEDIAQIETDLYGATSGQHDGLAACDATGLLNVANCADARSRHNEDEIEDVNDKLMQKKEYIDNLAAEIGVDPVTGEGTGEGGMSRIDMNAQAISDEVKARMEADTMLGGRIDAEEKARMEADMALGGRIDAEEMARMEADTALGGRIDDEAMARMEADTALGGRIDDEEMARADADMALGMRIDEEAMARADADVMLGGMIMAEEMARTEADTMLGGMISAEEMARMEADTALGGRISSNADNIAANMNAIGQNRSAISDNRNMIGELSDDLDVVRAGVAASMALAGMPAINGRGISIGVWDRTTVSLPSRWASRSRASRHRSRSA